MLAIVLWLTLRVWRTMEPMERDTIEFRDVQSIVNMDT
jgi:hypothetical protein